MPLGPKMGPPRGHIFCIDLYRENMKNILSETTGPRALIFGIKHHLVDLYQFCSNNATRAKVGPQGSHKLI